MSNLFIYRASLIFIVFLLVAMVSSSVLPAPYTWKRRTRFRRQLDLVFSNPGGGPMRLTGFGWDGRIFDPSMGPGSYTPTADIVQLNL
uniref:Secreted protein n=1 Tax=Ascaris lumbricoides TaxID=6252 RepID=A0A0M3I110_ASCLU